MSSIQDVQNADPEIEDDANETMETFGDGISFLSDLLGVIGLGGVAQLVNKFQVFRVGFQVNNLLKKKQYYSDAGLANIWAGDSQA